VDDPRTAELVDEAIYALSVSGPTLGRLLVDSIAYSKIRNLKELRPASSGRSEVRILSSSIRGGRQSCWLRVISRGGGDGGIRRRSRAPSISTRST
jgi:hypothetical protein